MDTYVKISTLWKLFNKNESVYLLNLFNSKMFRIDDLNKQNIIKRIQNVVALNELEVEYKDIWYNFKKELEENYVIYYSSEKHTYCEPMQMGGRLTNSSKFICNPPNIGRIFIEFTGFCDLDCSDCNMITDFPCLSCFKNNNSMMDLMLFRKAIKEFSRYGIKELYILGGDPLLSYVSLIECIEEYFSIIKDGKVVVITNGSKFLNMNDAILSRFKELGIIFLIQVVDNLNYNDIISILNNYKIFYELVLRNSDSNEIQFNANSVERILEKKESFVTKENLKRPIGLYENTYFGIKNRCYDGKIHIKNNGDICVCAGYLEPIGNLQVDEVSEIINRIERLYLREELPKECKTCGVVDICYSCNYVKEVFNEKFSGKKLCDV